MKIGLESPASHFFIGPKCLDLCTWLFKPGKAH